MSKIKGQNLRLCVGGKCIAAATSCTLHVAAQVEDASTKDSTGDWSEQECTGKSWDASADALVVIDSADTTGLDVHGVMALVGTLVEVKFDQTSGEKNRASASGAKYYGGNAIVSDISINAGNKQNATYSVQLQGVGALTVGTNS